MDSERECCSSSNESVLESDNDIYTEESDEEGGAVLVPRKTSSRHGGESQNQTDLVLHIIPIPAEVLCDSRGPLTFFIGCVRELRSKPIIQRSPRRQIADKVLQFMEEKRDECSEISVFLLGKVYACLVSGDKYKLPTTRAGYMWNSFHRFRNGQEVKKVWKSFITTIQAPSNESELALQVLLSAIIEKMLSNKASACASSTSTQQPDLTEREKNAVRYMAGYVAVSLLKRYKKPSSNKKLTLKRKLFVTVL